MFKGSALYGPGEVDRRTQALGGSNNAFTSHDVTAFWFSFAADRWTEGLAIEADRMRGLRLERAEVDSERSVILEEIAMYEDDPWDALDLGVQRTLFGDHPYGRPVIGTRDELETIGRDALAAFHAHFYRPDNAVLVVAGALDDSALERVSEAFGALAPGAGARAAVEQPTMPATETRVERHRGELTRLLVALPAPLFSGATEADHAALRLAATILAEGRASRLQRALVEEGQLCLGIGVSLSESVIASYMSIATDLLPGTAVEAAEGRLRAELDRLREEPVSDAELERARQIFYADWVHALERIHEQAVAAGLASALFDLDQPERMLAAVAAVTPATVSAAAQRWLDPAAGCVVGVSRAEDAPGSGPEAAES